jgi:hypothetical protein
MRSGIAQILLQDDRFRQDVKRFWQISVARYTVEISGFSHFFGFDRIGWSIAGTFKSYESLANRPKRRVGMAIAKIAAWTKPSF